MSACGALGTWPLRAGPFSSSRTGSGCVTFSAGFPKGSDALTTLCFCFFNSNKKDLNAVDDTHLGG